MSIHNYHFYLRVFEIDSYLTSSSYRCTTPKLQRTYKDYYYLRLLNLEIEIDVLILNVIYVAILASLIIIKIIS